MTPLQAITKSKAIMYDPDGNPMLLVSKRQARDIVSMCRSHDKWSGSQADDNNYWVEFALKENGDLWLHTNLDLSHDHVDQTGSNSWPQRDTPNHD